jgi:hypothetical protein
MKKKVLALSVLAAVSSQAGAFQLDTGDDWSIRFDNTLKGNVQARVKPAQNRVVNPAQFGNARLFDDADYSVNRKNGGITSSRIDLLSELDVIWRDNWGFRVSGAGWYDAAYENSDNPKHGVLPNTGLPYDYSWAGLSYKPGDYSNHAEDMSYAGGELLDAFVFGGGEIGDMAWGVRAGKHVIYWGQTVFPTGAITGIAGSMAAMDFGKGLGVPGIEVRELFLPSNKISGSLQFTDNMSISAYYEFDHLVHRYPSTGTWWSPAEVLTDDTQLAVLAAGTANSKRVGYRTVDDKMQSSGEFGFNFGYTIDAWDLETQWVYIKGSDRLLSGVYGSSGGLDPEKVAQWAKPWEEGGANANVIGQWGWVYRKDIETFGLSLSKSMFDISWGMDVVFRQNTGLNPEFLPSFIGRAPGTSPSDYSADPNDFPGPTGDVWGVVINGIGLLTPDWGIWDGGSWVVEVTQSWLDDFKDNEAYAKVQIHKNRVTTQIGASFKPEWYSVFPGWDLTLPMSVSYGIDGEQPPQSSISQEELGNASIGVQFLVNQVWYLTASYNTYFGPVENGIGGGLVDRDNVAFTVKRTF